MVGVEALAASLAIVVALAAMSEAVVEYFIAPLWERLGERFGVSAFWLRYIGAAASFALVFVSGQNLLGDYLPANLAILGRALTALLAGRGSNWIHDFFSAQRGKADQARALKALGSGWKATRIEKE